MLTLDEAVRARHSVRNFSNKPVDAAMLRKILDAGRLAPSAKNRQPWRFTVATDAQRKAAADLLAAQAGKERAADSTVGATAAIVRAAPVLVAVFLCGESRAPASDWISLGACLENMCLKAADLGLGSLIVCDSQSCERELGELFGRAGGPSALFLVGTEDPIVPVRTAEAFRDTMQRHGVDCELHLFEGAGHPIFLYREPLTENASKMQQLTDAFLQKNGFMPAE